MWSEQTVERLYDGNYLIPGIVSEKIQPNLIPIVNDLDSFKQVPTIH